jgi:hypothetical protein
MSDLGRCPKTSPSSHLPVLFLLLFLVWGEAKFFLNRPICQLFLVFLFLRKNFSSSYLPVVFGFIFLDLGQC